VRKNLLGDCVLVRDTSGMEIRSLTQADASAYWEARQQALKEEPLVFGSDAEEHRLSTVEHTAERLGDSPETSFTMGGFVGGAGGTKSELVGIATFVRGHSRKERHKGHIVGVYLASAYRGQGFGRALLEAVIARSADGPVLEQILLGVSTTQVAALRLYQSLGFAVYGTEPRSLKVGSMYVDEHLMILKLR
jgi:ribosomal protein S18 acetylase RimI-like enzyme